MKPFKVLGKTLKSLAVELTWGQDGCVGVIPFESKSFRFIASWGMDWEHVSISLPNRCPTWREMRFFKDVFWNDGECVIQYHPPKENYINCHKYCLHLWKPRKMAIPQPPKKLVGI